MPKIGYPMPGHSREARTASVVAVMSDTEPAGGHSADGDACELESFGGDGEDDEAGEPGNEGGQFCAAEPHETGARGQHRTEGLDEDRFVPVAAEQSGT